MNQYRWRMEQAAIHKRLNESETNRSVLMLLKNEQSTTKNNVLGRIDMIVRCFCYCRCAIVKGYTW